MVYCKKLQGCVCMWYHLPPSANYLLYALYSVFMHTSPMQMQIYVCTKLKAISLTEWVESSAGGKLLVGYGIQNGVRKEHRAH